MFDEMDRMFDQMRRSMWGTYGRPAIEAPARSRDIAEFDFGIESNLTLEETEDGYVVLADLPGFEKEEFDLRFDDGMLYIRAAHEVEGDGFARSRKISESIHVPGAVVAADISATYRNGVLEVHIPVEGEMDTGHHIDIE
jgi:HSP20 family protein